MKKFNPVMSFTSHASPYLANLHDIRDIISLSSFTICAHYKPTDAHSISYIPAFILTFIITLFHSVNFFIYII